MSVSPSTLVRVLVTVSLSWILVLALGTDREQVTQDHAAIMFSAEVFINILLIIHQQRIKTKRQFRIKYGLLFLN